MSKRRVHGLWATHRAINEANRDLISRGHSEIQWWIDRAWTNTQRDAFNHRYLAPSGYGNGLRFAPVALLRRCAARFMRRYRLPLTVKHWNETVYRIGHSGCYFYASSINAALCRWSDGDTEITLDDCGCYVDFDRNRANEEQKEIRRRISEWPLSLNELVPSELIEQMLDDGVARCRYSWSFGYNDHDVFFARERVCILRACVTCKQIIGGNKIAPRLRFSGRASDYEETSDVRCWPCYNRLRPIALHSRDIEATRLMIGRIKREITSVIRQTIEDVGRTARIPCNDDARGEERRR